MSNQTLRLDNTFKVYLKVLSIEHMKFKSTTKPRIHKKRSKNTYKKHYGARNKNSYTFFWALDVPDSFPNEKSPNIFKNKCLLTTTILGLLQHQYFESKRSDKRFIHVQNINSKNYQKKNHAGRILEHELNNFLEKTELPRDGPYDLESTVQKLSKIYKCQFFIFDNMFNSNKLNFMFPSEYDDSLKPIFLFQPNDAKNHLVFIRNLNSYFKANVKICFACKRTFSTHNYRHLCTKAKCCFSCRRFFQSPTTYVHEKLSQYFCNKNITAEESFTCVRCNVTCYSQHCFNGHKFFCSGKGNFGYKCLKCQKFTYRHGKMTSDSLKQIHVCGENKKCPYCRESKDLDHLCKLNKEVILPNSSRLAFIGMEFLNSEISTKKNAEDTNADSPIHNEPLLVQIYREEKQRGNFTKYELNYFDEKPALNIVDSILTIPYEDVMFNNIKKNRSKITQDFKTNCEKLQNTESLLLSNKLLQLITSVEWQNTTFICQDSDSLIYVSLRHLIQQVC